jgi:shikimate dehydrogenase
MRLFGLIGYPLTHSFSPEYFKTKFVQERITGVDYRLFPLDRIQELPELLLQESHLHGLNITIPYKETVCSFLDEIDEEASKIGAVNTITIDRSRIGRYGSFYLKGFNTDAYGFRQSLKPFLTSVHERALILGTGGASKSVDHVLRTIGIDTLFVSSSGKKLDNRTVFRYEDINTYILKACKLIVNTTPIGQYPAVNAAPALPYSVLSSEHLLYDLIYNPPETEFLRLGSNAGAITMNGLDMLRLQAEKAWQIWNGNVN